MRLDPKKYYEIRKKLNRISDFNKFDLPRGVLHSILVQKKVESVKRKYHIFSSRGDEVLRYWEENKSLPRWLTLTPVMKVRILLKAMGLSAREIGKALRRPDVLDSELCRVVYKAVSVDFAYSPIATRIQSVLGQMGEKIIEEKLKSLGIKFKKEKELKTQKTPDFLLEEPMEFCGKNVFWIESKVVFADQKIYDLYFEKQFKKYLELFGDGMVVFWRGCLDYMNASDGSEFDGELKRKILEMEIRVSRSDEVDGNPIEIAEDFVKSYANREIFPYNREVVRILRNMGFAVRQED
uniref:CDAN1-interacting nuclease 1 n=1 Tax=Archaeoglobus fulgidus TaxID=2234 RepID=A0A7J2TJV9_ARCFL